uniref:Uncharacterized protein n=1 Tax=Spongospora subterranea TaxID=70186 RepID=A0A0H5R374_9EUKA|eukprot:CRZ08307.1 hypothetical protein [Spongospora subterranea]
MVALYCTYCAALHGQCKTDCQGNQLSTQLSINKTLTGLLEYGAISQNRRRAGNRTKIVNSTAKMVNITAYPAAIHPVTLKTFKLEQGAAVNNVFTLDSTYDQVVSEIQNYLFPYPQWKFANHELSTSDGARIIENTPFSRFPFNLSSSGKKTLWLIRKESQDLHRPAIDCTDDHLLCNDDTYLPFELPNDICEGRSLADIPVIVDPSKKKSTCPNAFGIHPEISYPEFHQFYDEAKDDRGSNTNAVAILRQYDVSTTPPRWTEKFLYDFTAPNLEDPVEDGGCKTVFKDGLFKCVFGEACV